MTNGAGLKLHGTYITECRDKNGSLKWADTHPNYVPDGGLDHMLKLLDNSTTIITAWYIGLLATHTAMGDTTVLTDITEATEYGPTATGGAGSGTRQVWTQALTAATRRTLSNTGNLATFGINKDGTTIGGAFIVSSDNPGNTNGILLSGSSFTGGAKSADSGDVLTVTYTLTARDQSV